MRNCVDLRLSLISAAAIVLNFIGASAESQSPRSTKLDGWDKYHFGMQISDARKVAGATLSAPPKGNQYGNYIFLRATEYGQDVRVRLRFSSTTGLKAVNLELSGDHPGGWLNLSADECEKRFQSALLSSERRYGVFSSREQSLLPMTSSHNIDFGNSQYSITASDIQPGWAFRSAGAIRGTEKGSIAIQMQYSAINQHTSTCAVRLEFLSSD